MPPRVQTVTDAYTGAKGEELDLMITRLAGLWLFHPVTDKAARFLAGLPLDPGQRFGPAVGLEPRYGTRFWDELTWNGWRIQWGRGPRHGEW